MESPLSTDVIHSTDYLSQKYGGAVQQTPLSANAPHSPAFAGAGGQGRKMKNGKGEDLFWTQKNGQIKAGDVEQLKGGHGVPLSSESEHCVLSFFSVGRRLRMGGGWVWVGGSAYQRYQRSLPAAF